MGTGRQLFKQMLVNILRDFQGDIASPVKIILRLCRRNEKRAKNNRKRTVESKVNRGTEKHDAHS